ncbi:transmembrane amino acid transporter [Xylariaceae sp. FL1651]|nr:transmembrane amino acid transporter [Xylariaceae sp. FL1651]
MDSIKAVESQVQARSIGYTHNPSQNGSHPCNTRHATHGHDASVTFEEYLYWAKITRAKERDGPLRREAGTSLAVIAGSTKIASELEGGGSGSPIETETEWGHGNRALRSAGWGAVFYLITTDILGPFSTPWAFAQLGYGPGLAIFTVFGALSTYSGWILWQAYLDLDSDVYPLRGYADFFFRLYGPASRHIVNISQSLQLLLAVSVTMLSVGQSISQISQGPDGGPGICFIVCILIVMLAGILLGQIRTLQKFSWLASIAVWLTFGSVLICSGVVAKSPPNFVSTVAQYGPSFGPGQVIKFVGLPPDGLASGGSGFVGVFNGLNQAVSAYGGAMLFASFLAEMRQPMDFWKALVCAEFFIYVIYVFFGIFVYSYQGQFALNPAIQGLSPYRWQTAVNVINLGAGLAAATLYSNVGLKVLYQDVLQELFNAPNLSTSRGKIYWAGLVPIYWIVAFVVCASVPSFSFVTGLIGAVFIISFSYTFPALIAIAYTIKKDAITDGEAFVPEARSSNYAAGGSRRLFRGFKKRLLFNVWNIVYCLGALATCALGIYSSLIALIEAFSGHSAAVSWGCTPPV